MKAALALLLALTPLQPSTYVDGAAGQVTGAALKAPADPVARKKFPKEPPQYVDALSFANKLANQLIQPMTDRDHYGLEDRAVGWPDDLRGDCEDYALSKKTTLNISGYPSVLTRLRSVWVNLPEGRAAHAILEVKMPNGAIAMLDNRYPDLMTRPELEARGYQFFDW